MVAIPEISSLLNTTELNKNLIKGIKKGESSNNPDGITGLRVTGVRELVHRMCFIAMSIERLATSKHATVSSYAMDNVPVYI